MTLFTSEHQTYIELCKYDKVVPQEHIIGALKNAGATGVLDLSKRNHPTWMWKALGKIIVSSTRIHTLMLSDCYIPPEGLAAICTSLCQNTIVHSVDFRGNNLQTTSVSTIGKVLRHNTAIKTLTLEWNSMGIFLDAFSMFCDGLAVNQTLEVLCLKNNQISPECAPLLARAIVLNKALQKLDLRWNNLGWKGGQHLQEAMKHNQTLMTIRVRGNCMPEDLVKAIELSGHQNKRQEKATKKLEFKTEVLFHHLQKADIERENMIRDTKERIENEHKESKEIMKESQERLQDVVKESDSRISQLEDILTERALTIKSLQSQVQNLDVNLKTSQNKSLEMEKKISEQENFFQELISKHKQSEEDLKKKLSEKEDENILLKMQAEADLSAERRQKSILQSRIDSHMKDIKELETEVQKHGDKLRLSRSEHEESLLVEHSLHQEQLLKVEREYEGKLTKLQTEMTYIRTSLQEEVREIERNKEELQKKNGELASQLAMEQAKSDEKVAMALQQARAREEARVCQLEDKLSLCREEKMATEKQMSLAHSTTTQLQQHNAALIAEMGEPQRKLTKMHEDLSNERLTNQRLRQELSEEAAKVQTKYREIESLQNRLQDSQAKIIELTHSIAEHSRERQSHEERVQGIVAEKERELKTIRLNRRKKREASCNELPIGQSQQGASTTQDEAERASALYAAFSKYLNSLSPGSTKTMPTL